MKLSLKNYAAAKNVSYEAVRQQVKRYAADLEGHIIKEGRTQFLDEFACDFLDEKRNKNPIVIYETNKDEELQQLRADVDRLRAKLFEKQNKIEKLQDELLNSERENKRLLIENKELQLMLAPKEPEHKKGFFSRFFG